MHENGASLDFMHCQSKEDYNGGDNLQMDSPLPQAVLIYHFYWMEFGSMISCLITYKFNSRLFSMLC